MDVRQRAVGFIVVIAILACFIAWYASDYSFLSRSHPDDGNRAMTDPIELARVMAQPFAMFRSMTLDGSYGKIALVPLPAAGPRRYIAPLECDRVDFEGGTGVCLTANRGVITTYSAVIFDSAFTNRHEIPLAGIPSRVRVSPAGTVAGITVFVSGHSYAATNFSTQTLLVDTRTGETIADLEQFEVLRDGVVFKGADFNFWGVTFRPDSQGFLATLSTAGHFYLIDGRIDTRRAVVIVDGVECPALAPDASRIAYKKRVMEGNRLKWRLAIRTLGRADERVLPGETRSVDDQVEWLDNETILYGAPDDGHAGSASVWALPIDGGTASRLIPDAFSPAVPTR
jgi:hypothetical protein